MSSTQNRRDTLIQQMVDIGRKNSTSTVLFHHVLAEQMGLNPTDHKCVDIIMQRGPMTAGQLAEFTGLTTGSITTAIDRLEKANLLRRVGDPNDRRKVLLHVNQEGFPEMGAFFGPFLEAQDQLFAQYSDEELALILGYLEKSTQLLENHAAAMRKRR